MKWKLVILVWLGSLVAGSLFGVGEALVARQKAGQVAVEVSSSPTISPTPTPVPVDTTDTREITIIFGGDVMLGRTVQSRMESYGATWPFKEIAKTMQDADLTVVNLESPFRKGYPETPIDSLVLRGDPQGVAGLTLAGVDGVSLANNHITDMAKVGMEETFSILTGEKVAYTGAGASTTAAEVPMVLEAGGMKVGFVSATYGVNFSSSGVYFNTATESWVAEQVASLKKTVDQVVFLCHCGNEYATTPSASQKAVAQAAITAGASLVIGHHPHVPQPVEKFGNGVIVYSLGNLVFDQLPGNNRDQSALAKVTLTSAGVKSLELIPYKIYDYGQPRLLTSESDKAAVWKAFGLADGKL